MPAKNTRFPVPFPCGTGIKIGMNVFGKKKRKK
jgi:hypothetical protein